MPHTESGDTFDEKIPLDRAKLKQAQNALIVAPANLQRTDQQRGSTVLRNDLIKSAEKLLQEAPPPKVSNDYSLYMAEYQDNNFNS